MGVQTVGFGVGGSVGSREATISTKRLHCT